MYLLYCFSLTSIQTCLLIAKRFSQSQTCLAVLDWTFSVLFKLSRAFFQLSYLNNLKRLSKSLFASYVKLQTFSRAGFLMINRNKCTSIHNFKKLDMYRMGIWKCPPTEYFHKKSNIRKISSLINFLDMIPNNRHNWVVILKMSTLSLD